MPAQRGGNIVRATMNAPLPTALKFDLQGLVRAIALNHAFDSFNSNISTQQWETLAGYLQPFALMQGQVLIEQGGNDRSLYFIESGSLSVHYEDDKGRVRLAIVGPGSVVGEGAFFSHLPRNATVQAAAASKLWCLTPIRFTELSNRRPEIALEIAMALGGIVARRLVNRPKRVAVT